MQVYLQSLPNRSLSYAKIVQGERKDASLLAIFAELSLSNAKIVQGERKDASLLAIFAEPQPI